MAQGQKYRETNEAQYQWSTTIAWKNGTRIFCFTIHITGKIY